MSSCSTSVCGKPKSFVDLSWSNTDRYNIETNQNCPYPVTGSDVGVDAKWCNTDPSVYVCGHVNTDNVGNIPMRGACSYPNKYGFYKKQHEQSNWTETYGNGSMGSSTSRPPKHLRISQTYLGDISPMFGYKTAYENVYGPIIPPLSSIVPVSSVLTYPDGQPYHTYYN